jgi:predicted component of type VI protein secretion system
MNVRLIHGRGNKRKIFPLLMRVAVLGRAHGNAVRIPSPEVSRRHCKFVIEDDIVTLEDLDSVNGTFLNGRKIRSREVVQPGDKIEVGPVTFTLEYELSRPARAHLHPEEVIEEIELVEAVEAPPSPDEEIEVLEPLGDDADDIPILEPIDDDEEDLPEVEILRPPSDPGEPLEAEADAEFELEAETPWANLEDDEPPTHYLGPKKH